MEIMEMFNIYIAHLSICICSSQFFFYEKVQYDIPVPPGQNK